VTLDESGRRLADARARVERFLAELDHVGIEDVALVSLPAADVAARASARSTAVTAAGAAGLGPYLTKTREDVRARVIRMYDRNMYQPTWAGLNFGRSLGTIEDRVAVAAAFEDAAIGTVAMDVVSADVTEELAEPMRLLIAMHPNEPPRSQFAGTRWTARIGALLFLVFVASTVAVLGAYFGPLGWAMALAIVVAAGIAIARDRSAT
jgi:hypothetical protein